MWPLRRALTALDQLPVTNNALLHHEQVLTGNNAAHVFAINDNALPSQAEGTQTDPVAPTLDSPTAISWAKGNEGLQHIFHWRVARWSELQTSVEFRSPMFTAEDSNWLIRIYKGRQQNAQAFSIYLHCDRDSLYGIKKFTRITFCLGNQKKYGSNSNANNFVDFTKIEQPVWFSESHPAWGEECLLELGNVTQYVRDDLLLIYCKLEVLRVVGDFLIPRTSVYSSYYNIPDLSDVQLLVHPGDGTAATHTFTQFFAHKTILSMNSPFFFAMFSPTSTFRESTEPYIKLYRFDVNAFELALKWIYGVEVKLRGIGIDMLEKLLEVAERCQLQYLREECLRHLRLAIEYKTVWHIWSIAERYQSPETIQQSRAFVAHNFETLRLLTQDNGSQTPSRVHTPVSTQQPTISNVSTMGSSTIKDQQTTTTTLISSTLTSMLQLQSVDASVIQQVISLNEMNVDCEEHVYEFLVDWCCGRNDLIATDQTNITTSHNSSSIADAMRNKNLLDVSTPLSNSLSQLAVAAEDECDRDDPDHTEAFTDNTISATTIKPPTTDYTKGASTSATSSSSPSSITAYIGRTTLAEKLDAMIGLLQHVRFPLMDKQYLVESVESHHLIMSIPGTKDLLLEAYRFLLTQGSPMFAETQYSKERITPRRQVAFSEELLMMPCM